MTVADYVASGMCLTILVASVIVDARKHRQTPAPSAPTVERDEHGNVITWCESADLFTDGGR